jgi:hypothetical protein
MSKQQSINEKLFALQQEIGAISKDANNPFYKSKYFDINSLLKQLQPLLKKHKLLLIQPIEEDMVYSKILCIEGTGGVISGLKLPELNDPQKLGSAITYYRRYTLQSLLALQAEDDDGNVASGKTTKDKKRYLNRGTIEYSEAIKWLQQGGNIEAIKNKFVAKKDVWDELAKL